MLVWYNTELPPFKRIAWCSGRPIMAVILGMDCAVLSTMGLIRVLWKGDASVVQHRTSSIQAHRVVLRSSNHSSHLGHGLCRSFYEGAH